MRVMNLPGAPFIFVPIKACDTLIEHTSLSKGYGAMAKPVRPLWGCQTENSKTASDVVFLACKSERKRDPPRRPGCPYVVDSPSHM
jgi:hypothetical protein